MVSSITELIPEQEIGLFIGSTGGGGRSEPVETGSDTENEIYLA